MACLTDIYSSGCCCGSCVGRAGVHVAHGRRSANCALLHSGAAHIGGISDGQGRADAAPGCIWGACRFDILARSHGRPKFSAQLRGCRDYCHHPRNARCNALYTDT